MNGNIEIKEVFEVETVTIVINESPYGEERAWNALRFATAAASSMVKMKVNVFLLGDGISIARKGQSPPQGYYNLEKMLEDLIKMGVKIRVCDTCARARGLDKGDLVAGVEMGTMINLANWVKESQKVLTF